MPASVAAAGRSRRPVVAQRRPRRATIRRWMAAARSNSMSCSQIAHASASNGSGRRITRRYGRARTERPITRIGAEAVVEGAQVVVDAEREAHAPHSLLGHVGAVGAGHEHHAITRGLADADDRGRPLDVQQPLEAAVAAAAHDAVGAARGAGDRATPDAPLASPRPSARLYASRPTRGARGQRLAPSGAAKRGSRRASAGRWSSARSGGHCPRQVGGPDDGGAVPRGGRTRAGDDDPVVALGGEVAHVGAGLCAVARQAHVGVDRAQARVDERAAVARGGCVDDDRRARRGMVGAGCESGADGQRTGGDE